MNNNFAKLFFENILIVPRKNKEELNFFFHGTTGIFPIIILRYFSYDNFFNFSAIGPLWSYIKHFTKNEDLFEEVDRFHRKISAFQYIKSIDLTGKLQQIGV